MISAHDGRPLPASIGSYQMAHLIQCRRRNIRPPDWFLSMPFDDRRRIVAHMWAMRVDYNQVVHFGYPLPVVPAVAFRYEPDHAITPNPFVHEPPNGGNRVLPSVYATLTDAWVTNQGEIKKPVEMTTGHLNNTVKLVRESHKNVSGKINELLGRAGNHLRNVPHLVEKLEEIAREVEELDIEDVYPIWGPLTRELATRHPTERAFVEMHPNKPGLPLREGFLRTTARLDPEDSNYGGF